MRKLKMMLCVMMLLVVVGCTSKQSVRPCVKPPLPPAWIMQSPQTGRQTPLNGLFHPPGTTGNDAGPIKGAQQYITEQCLNKILTTMRFILMIVS